MIDLVVAVLLNYNQNEYTLKCIDSLIDNDYENLKIVLIDNGSSQDNVIKLIEKLPKDNKLIFKRIENNIGYAQGTNFGLKEGLKLNPDYYLIMNNDTIIDKSAIKELVKTCKNFNNKAIVTGKVYHYDQPKILQFVGYSLNNLKVMDYKHMGLDELDEGQYDMVEEREMIDDIFVLQPASLYKSIGGYSPFLWINGVNIDMALRAIKVGYKLIFTPKAKLWHKGSVSIGGRNMNPKLAFWGIESYLILGYLYLNRIDFFYYYVKTIESVVRTFLKSRYLKYFKQKDISDYASAKFKGLLAFNKWVIRKNNHSGFNPY